jgi:hypothetical protein
MKNSKDYVIREQSLEYSSRIVSMCLSVPESETTRIFAMLHDLSLNQTMDLDCYLHSRNNEERMFYLENALVNMRKTMITLEVASRNNLIDSKDYKEILRPLAQMIDQVCDRMSIVQDEVEKERLNFSMSFAEQGKFPGFPSGKRLD